MNRTTFGLYARATKRRFAALEAIEGLPAEAVAEITALHHLANGIGEHAAAHYGVTLADTLTPVPTDPADDSGLQSGGDDKE